LIIAARLSLFFVITEIRRIQLSNSGGGVTFNGVPGPTNQLVSSHATRPQQRPARRLAVAQVPLNVVFFGPPGAGKGTQADRFAERHGIPKISTGDILRKAIQDGTRVGALVRDALLRGALVGDDLIVSIVAERLEQPDTANGFVLDGCPRTLPQAAALDAMLADRGGVQVIALVVHADEVIRRLAERGREDDDVFVIKERLAVYARETEPVLEYYRRRGVVTVLDGNRPLDEVTEAIESAVKSKKT
jgi:adenylate kinase